ncbi:cytochrome P450 [Rhodococcus sp. NPDC058514]|uniref:cytochrome P450 n=1 Tax=unclassified Rhodococcus (in: high G+C Gram-positive bacteria) TaxID=192944 RepID=UPI003658C888
MTADTYSPSILDVDLPTVAYQNTTDPLEAHRIIAGAAAQGPIAMGPYGPEVLAYDLVRTVLRDPRFAMPKGVTLQVQGITSGPVWDRVSKVIVSLDGADHARLRRLVSKVFTPSAVARLKGLAVEVVTELVDRVADRGDCDVVADIAKAYPVPIICALLGAPREDWPRFADWAADITRAFGMNVAADAPDIVRAWDGLAGYVEAMITERRRSLTDDLISDLIRAEADGGHLTVDELIDLAAILLTAGTDTTRNQLAAAVQALSEHPDQWDLLARDPELAPAAVEELMRWSPVVFGCLRVTREDVDLGGVRIPAGTFVVANTAAANRDPAVYDQPERLDITRHGPPAMLTFGGGVHYCLGSHLARLELAEALRVLTQRMCNPRLAGPVPWKPMVGLSGPRALQIEWDATPRGYLRSRASARISG